MNYSKWSKRSFSMDPSSLQTIIHPLIQLEQRQLFYFVPVGNTPIRNTTSNCSCKCFYNHLDNMDLDSRTIVYTPLDTCDWLVAYINSNMTVPYIHWSIEALHHLSMSLAVERQWRWKQLWKRSREEIIVILLFSLFFCLQYIWKTQNLRLLLMLVYLFNYQKKIAKRTISQCNSSKDIDNQFWTNHFQVIYRSFTPILSVAT